VVEMKVFNLVEELEKERKKNKELEEKIYFLNKQIELLNNKEDKRRSIIFNAINFIKQNGDKILYSYSDSEDLLNKLLDILKGE
jgi:cell division protein FtsB